MSDLTPEIVAQGRQLRDRWQEAMEKGWPTHGIIKGVALHFLRHGEAYAIAAEADDPGPSYCDECGGEILCSSCASEL